MRGDNSTALLLVSLAVIIGGPDLSAHRRDEYLQAARLAIEPGRVDVELDLTPGLALADALIADIDRDRDGVLSTSEKRAYVGTIVSAVELQIDGRLLRVERVDFTFPDPDTVRRGEGTIQLKSSVALPDVSNGRHQLFFRNSHRSDVSAYLANALVPSSDRIAVTGQTRDADQRDLTIDFVVKTQSAASTPAWLLGALAGAALVLALVTRSSKAGQVLARPGRFMSSR